MAKLKLDVWHISHIHYFSLGTRVPTIMESSSVTPDISFDKIHVLNMKYVPNMYVIHIAYCNYQVHNYYLIIRLALPRSY